MVAGALSNLRRMVRGVSPRHEGCNVLLLGCGVCEQTERAEAAVASRMVFDSDVVRFRVLVGGAAVLALVVGCLSWGAMADDRHLTARGVFDPTRLVLEKAQDGCVDELDRLVCVQPID